MITTIAPNNTVSIPEAISQRFALKPGSRLEWQAVEGKDEIVVRVLPNRGELARQLLGAGRRFSPERDSVADLIAERESEA